MNSSKHARQRSRDIDDDDICPTTPTRESWTLAQAQQQPLHKRRNSSLRQSFSIPFTNTANGIEHDAHRNSALFAPTQDPRTTASSSHDTPVNGIISPASSPANGSSAAHGASTSVGSVADIVGGMPFGLRRRSMNVVSGERPLLDLEGMGMGIGV